MSHTIEIQSKAVNFEALSTTLLDSLGEKFLGLSVNDESIIISLANEPTKQDTDVAQQIVASHDATVLSPKQLEHQQRYERLLVLRQTVGMTLLTDAEIEALPEAQQFLARKIAWLELELLAIRGSFI